MSGTDAGRRTTKRWNTDHRGSRSLIHASSTCRTTAEPSPPRPPRSVQAHPPPAAATYTRQTVSRTLSRAKTRGDLLRMVIDGNACAAADLRVAALVRAGHDRTYCGLNAGPRSSSAAPGRRGAINARCARRPWHLRVRGGQWLRPPPVAALPALRSRAFVQAVLHQPPSPPRPPRMLPIISPPIRPPSRPPPIPDSAPPPCRGCVTWG